MIEFLLGAAVSAALYYACYMAGRERGRDKGYNAALEDDEKPIVMEHQHEEE